MNKETIAQEDDTLICDRCGKVIHDSEAHWGHDNEEKICDECLDKMSEEEQEEFF